MANKPDATTMPDDAEHALRSAYVALAFAFRRLHSSARSRDGELCETFIKIRAEIETVMRAHGRMP